MDAESEQHVFAIRAANVGLVPTTITGCWSEVEGAAYHVAWARFHRQIPARLPHTIPPGDHWTGFIQEAEFKRAIGEMAETLSPPWRVRVGVRDAATRSYTSPALEMSPDD